MFLFSPLATRTETNIDGWTAMRRRYTYIRGDATPIKSRSINSLRRVPAERRFCIRDRPISLRSSREIGSHAAISIRNAHRMTDHSFGGSSRHLLTYRRRRNASGELSAVQKRNKTAPTRADRNDRKLPPSLDREIISQSAHDPD